MAFSTRAGQAAGIPDSSGLKQLAGSLSAADLNTQLKDTMSAQVYGEIAGVLTGGATTASGLNVTVPDRLTFQAGGQVWINAGDLVVAVPDSATTYLWGCADGGVRTSSAPTPPSGGWDLRTSCLLTVAVAAAGVATVDDTGRIQARYVDTATGRLYQGPMVVDHANHVVDLSSGAVLIPSLSADPGSPADGQIWHRSDLDQIRVRAGGATKVFVDQAAAAILPTGTANPGSPTVGQQFYRTDLGKQVTYNGSVWKDMAGATTA